MKTSIVLGGIAAAVGLMALSLPTTASAACRGATTGTVVGGVGGALIGNAISHNAGGTILGGVGGAVVGHEIGRSGCAHHAARTYERHGTRYYGSAQGPAQPAAPPGVYYDHRGQPVYPDGAYASAASTSYGSYAPWGDAPCRSEDQSFYDARGELVQRAVQVCNR
jgi:hypothetical protein